MNLISDGTTTTRQDGLPYDVLKIGKNLYQFRATGNPSKPIVITTTTYTEAIMMLVAQAPELTTGKVNA